LVFLAQERISGMFDYFSMLSFMKVVGFFGERADFGDV
jgi:hypothetical protein